MPLEKGVRSPPSGLISNREGQQGCSPIEALGIKGDRYAWKGGAREIGEKLVKVDPDLFDERPC